MTPRVLDIQKAVCAHYEIPLEEMQSQRQQRLIARPRQIAMYLAKQMTPHSLPAIGRMFGNRDHSTVIHAVRKVESLRASDPQIERAISRIRQSASIMERERIAAALEYLVS